MGEYIRYRIKWINFYEFEYYFNKILINGQRKVSEVHV